MLRSVFHALGEALGVGGGPTHTVLTGHTNHVWCLAVTDDTVFSGSADGSIIAWSAAPPHAIQGKLLGHTGVVYALRVHSDRLISGSSDGSLRAWDVARRTCEAVSDIPSAVLSLAIARRRRTDCETLHL